MNPYFSYRRSFMPGYILHITAAKMLFDKVNWDFVDQDAFCVGNLIADSVKDKTYSHFRHPSRNEKLMVYPDLDLFLAKYKTLLYDSSCLGYYFHLFIDRVYAKDYIPQIITFYDENGIEASERELITHALIKRTGELIPIKTIFSDEYYYGDFTKLNTYLIQRFNLSTSLRTDVSNPGITEVNYEDISTIQKQLQGYLNVPVDAVNTLKLFDIEDLLKFLVQAVDMFISMLNII